MAAHRRRRVVALLLALALVSAACTSAGQRPELADPPAALPEVAETGPTTTATEQAAATGSTEPTPAEPFGVTVIQTPAPSALLRAVHVDGSWLGIFDGERQLMGSTDGLEWAEVDSGVPRLSPTANLFDAGAGAAVSLRERSRGADLYASETVDGWEPISELATPERGTVLDLSATSSLFVRTEPFETGSDSLGGWTCAGSDPPEQRSVLFGSFDGLQFRALLPPGGAPGSAVVLPDGFAVVLDAEDFGSECLSEQQTRFAVWKFSTTGFSLVLEFDHTGNLEDSLVTTTDPILALADDGRVVVGANGGSHVSTDSSVEEWDELESPDGEVVNIIPSADGEVLVAIGAAGERTWVRTIDQPWFELELERTGSLIPLGRGGDRLLLTAVVGGEDRIVTVDL